MRSSFRRAALALAALTIAGSALAVDVSKSMSPERRAAYFRALAAMKASGPMPAPGGAIDTTPPQLTSFMLTPPADVAAPFAQIRLDVTATDDLSGVWNYYMTLVGPHGQRLEMYQNYLGLALKNYSGHAAADTNAYMEPGVWHADYMFVYDLAGNYAYYDATALASLGNAEISLANGKSKLVDLTLPTFKSGKVLTPDVSVSGHAKGTTQPPVAAADIVVADAGSGTQVAFATWCLSDQSYCITTQQQESARGVSKETLHTVTQIFPQYPPGDYLLEYLAVIDFAGNDLELVGTDFGGSTDFSQYMPAGHTITLKP